MKKGTAKANSHCTTLRRQKKKRDTNTESTEEREKYERKKIDKAQHETKRC